MNIRFQDFSEQAQGVAKQVVLIASRYGQVDLDIEHILLALLETPDERLKIIYKRLGLDEKELQEKLEWVVSKLYRENWGISKTNKGGFFSSPRVKKVIELAQLEADKLSDKKTSPVHLFWAVIYLYANSESQTAVGKILTELGITPSRVHELILKG